MSVFHAEILSVRVIGQTPKEGNALVVTLEDDNGDKTKVTMTERELDELVGKSSYLTDYDRFPVVYDPETDEIWAYEERMDDENI